MKNWKTFLLVTLDHHLLILSISSWDFEFVTPRSYTCLTYLKQDAMYDLIHAALNKFARQIWQVWFFFFYFISLLSCFLGNDKYQQNRVKSTTWNLLENIFSVCDFCLPTDLCFINSILILSKQRVYIKWIEYCSSILSSSKIINFVELVEIESCFINKLLFSACSVSVEFRS